MLLKNKLYKTSLSIFLVLMLTITCLPITASAAELEIVDIEFAPITIIEGTNGDYMYDYNYVTRDWDLEYFCYEPEYEIEYIITLKDGTTIEGDSTYFIYDNEYYYLDTETNQSYKNQWTVGNTYNMTVSFGNISTDVPVTITESPFKSIEAEPISIMEYTNGYYAHDYNYETEAWDLKYYYYEPEYEMEYTITLKDGTTIKGTDTWFEYEGIEFNLNIYTDQSYENQWTVGNTYDMTVSLGNISTDVPVTITKSPFESINIKPISITEYTNGVYDYDYNPETDDWDLEYFYYEPEYKIEYTITLTDGSTIKGTETWFEYEGTDLYFNIYTDQSYENQWSAGNTYNMTVTFSNFTVDVPVTITENPFKSIEVKPISIIEGTCGDYDYDYNPETDDWDLEYFYYEPEYKMEYTITLKDNTTIEGEGNRFEYNGEYYYFDIYTNQSYENQWTAGNTYTMNLSISNISVDVPVTITSSNPSPTLNGDVDNDGFITIKDATMVQEHVARLKTLTDTSATNADVDKSGDINIVDATYIQMYVAKQIKDFENL